MVFYYGLPTGALTMQRPLIQREKQFEQFLHALPEEWEALMREHGAFTYAGKIPSPQELLRAIFLYCGPDQSLREVAGTLTLHTERITDQAVWKRLQRCAPFLEALVKRMLPLDALPPVPPHLRFLACDGTTIQRPGATSADYRLHVVIDLLTLRFREVHISDYKRGERLQHYHLHAGDVAVVDQGYCSYAGLLDAVGTQGAAVIVRWNHRLPLYESRDPSRAINFCAALTSQEPGTIASFPVVLKYAEDRKNKDKRALAGALHVYRMTAKEAQVAQKKVSRKHQKKQRKLSATTLFLRQFVLVFTSLSSEVPDFSDLCVRRVCMRLSRQPPVKVLCMQWLMDMPSIVGIFQEMLSPGADVMPPTLAHQALVAGEHQRPSPPLHLRQRRFGLGQPEGHVHGAV
jgi:hypothetical protein